MILLFFLMISLFFGISTLLFIGKGDFLIAWLNAMSEEEKEKIDTFKLNRFMGKMMYVGFRWNAVAFSLLFLQLFPCIGAGFVASRCTDYFYCYFYVQL